MAGLKAEEYSKFDTMREHVLAIPATYIGSDKPMVRDEYVFDFEINRVKKVSLDIPEGVCRVLIEILSNAGDNITRSREHKIDPGMIEMTMDSKTITIINQGAPIPVEKHSKWKEWVPTVIFGQLLSGSNYDKSKIRSGAGVNGIGAKATNIFSTEFIVDIKDGVRGKSFYQVFSKNMSVKSEPVIDVYPKGKTNSSVSITYTLDFERFGLNSETGYPQEIKELFARYLMDYSMNAQVPVSFNGVKYDYRDIKEYSTMYFEEETMNNSVTIKGDCTCEVEKDSDETGKKKKKVTVTTPYELCLIDTPDQAIQVSFVNAMMTSEGGVHVDKVYKLLFPIISDMIKKEDNTIKLNSKDLTQHLSLVLNIRLPDPGFRSQSKTCLASPEPNFTISPESVAEIRTWDLIERLQAALQAKQFKTLSKTDGSKRGHIDVPKLDDANRAGRRESAKCTLALCEGDSAKGYLVTALKHIPDGRDYFGIFPLRGKLINARTATTKKMSDSREITNVKIILGLQEGVDYSLDDNFKKLRYGHLLIVTDADPDGAHIFGLIINYFSVKFASLLKRGFISFLRTPIVRVTKGKKVEKFYTHASYEEWKTKNRDWASWKSKYYKGLGTSTKEDIANDFKEPRYIETLYDDKAEENLKVVFDGKYANQRKEWLTTWSEALDVAGEIKLTISDFLNKEMIHYSFGNLLRAIPSFADGLKKSQRQILWAAFKKWPNPKKLEEMKVGQFANFVAEYINYHHGENSLAMAVVGMAQDFVGSNNLQFFEPRGNFGTRNQGGKDAASPRYIFTVPEQWIYSVFKEEDIPLLTLTMDDGKEQEPYFFLPVIPSWAFNGSLGIATGWSTFIPNYAPMDIVKWFLERLKGTNPDAISKLTPWYRGFHGKISIKYNKKALNNKAPALPLREITPPTTPVNQEEQEEIEPEINLGDLDDEAGDNEPVSMVTEGEYSAELHKGVRITELPIGKWTETYKDWLESLRYDRKRDDKKKEDDKETKKMKVTDIECKSDDVSINFFVKGIQDPSIKKLRLRKSIGLNNMVLLNEQSLPVKYETFASLLEAFYQFRLPFYEKRRLLLIQQCEEKIPELKAKQAFIEAYIMKKFTVDAKRKEIVKAEIEQLGLNPKYMTSNLWALTMDEVEELNLNVAELMAKIEDLKKKTAKDLWKADLEEFAAIYKKSFGSK
jgi:DNA topoisomerase-2